MSSSVDSSELSFSESFVFTKFGFIFPAFDELNIFTLVSSISVVESSEFSLSESFIFNKLDFTLPEDFVLDFPLLEDFVLEEDAILDDSCLDFPVFRVSCFDLAEEGFGVITSSFDLLILELSAFLDLLFCAVSPDLPPLFRKWSLDFLGTSSSDLSTVFDLWLDFVDAAFDLLEVPPLLEIKVKKLIHETKNIKDVNS